MRESVLFGGDDRDRWATMPGAQLGLKKGLIGEALHLGKPMFVLPERAHGEQSTNSFFLREMACGDFEYLENVTLDQVKSFLDNLEQYRIPLGKVVGQMDGTETVLEIIHRWMNRQEDSRSTKVTGTKKTKPNAL